MASRVWGPFAFIAILAILNSALGNANAGINAGARMLFAMGRIRALPGALGQTNRYRTPGLAIVLVVVVGVVIAIWAGLQLGTTTGFAFIGALLTVPILLVYMATCLSVPFFYWREHREEFNIVKHVILPAIPVILLGIVIYFQFVPLPPSPFNLVGPLNAIWLVLGIIIVALLRMRAPRVLASGNTLFGTGEERA